MEPEQVADFVAPGIRCDPDRSPWPPALLSLAVPGLGQAWMGQWGRGIRLFAGSATLCFGLGFANLLVAYDAHSLARRSREQDVGPNTSSKSLLVFALVWKGVLAVIDGIADFLMGIQGAPPAVVFWILAVPFMFLSRLGGGKGFHRR